MHDLMFAAPEIIGFTETFFHVEDTHIATSLLEEKTQKRRKCTSYQKYDIYIPFKLYLNRNELIKFLRNINCGSLKINLSDDSIAI